MIKRICALLLLAGMAVFAACGSAGAAPSPSPAPEAAPPSESPTPPAPEETPFSRGHIEGQSYLSAFLALRFTAPEGWTFATDEELAALMGLSMDILGADVFGDEAELAKAIAQQSVVHDMAAYAPDNSSNVQLTLEDLEASGGDGLSDEDYAALVQQQLLSITDLGYSLEAVHTAELAGKNCLSFTAHMEDYGMEQQFYLFHAGKYMVSVVVTGMAGALPDAQTLFSAL